MLQHQANIPDDDMATMSATVGPAQGSQADTTEESPLLGRRFHSATFQSPLRILVVIVIVVVLSNISDQLMESPTTRLIESVTCYQYFARHNPAQLLTDPANAGPGALRGVAEASCKVDAVQGAVAVIRSYQFLLEGFPALLLAVPFAWLQDKYGRKPFLLLGMFSMLGKSFWTTAVLWYWQTFQDMRWIWASSLHALLMGGNVVVSSLYYTILADISAEQTRATIFLRLGACSLATTFAVPILTAWTMSFSPWIPVLIGLLLACISCGLVFLVPETLNYKHPELEEPVLEEVSTGTQLLTTPLPRRFLRDLKEGCRFLWQDYRVPVLMSPYLIHLLILSSTQFLVQYASKRYDFTVARATVLVTIRAAVNVLVLFSIIPAFSTLLMTRYNCSTKYKDLLITRLSLAVMAVGWVLTGVSPTSWMFVLSLVIASLGTGAMLTLRSLLTSLVSKQYIARTYSIMCIVDTLGVMFGSPLMAECFELGMSRGGLYIGLPFYLLGTGCAVFFLVLLFIRLRKDEHNPADTDE